MRAVRKKTHYFKTMQTPKTALALCAVALGSKLTFGVHPQRRRPLSSLGQERWGRLRRIASTIIKYVAQRLEQQCLLCCSSATDGNQYSYVCIFNMPLSVSYIHLHTYFVLLHYVRMFP